MDSLPPEIVLQILKNLPIQSIHSFQLLSRPFSHLILSNENQVYQSASFLHGFIPDDYIPDEPDSYSLLSKLTGSFMSSYMNSVTEWKTYFRKCWVIEARWHGEQMPSPPWNSAKQVTACGRHVHRFKIDEEEKTVLVTSRRGGLIVASVDTQEVLWFLPASYVREYSHIEFGGGFVIFDRPGTPVEVWRRSVDALDPSKYLPSKPDASQIHASPDTLPPSVVRGTSPGSEPPGPEASTSYTSASSINPPENFPRRGAYVPFALLENPAPVRAYRFVYPHLLLASPESNQAFVWHIPTSTLLQSVDIPAPGVPGQAEGHIHYVEISEEHIFVCWSTGLRAYRWKATPSGQKPGDMEFSIPPPSKTNANQAYVRRLTLSGGNPDHLLDSSILDPMHIFRGWQAVHVSPDGRDLVALCNDLIVFISDFVRVYERLSVTPVPAEIANALPGIFSVDMSVECYYLAFDGRRAAVSTDQGTYVFNLRDRRHVYPQPENEHEMAIPKKAVQISLPQLPFPTSCLQMTGSAVWTTDAVFSGVGVMNLVSCTDFADVDPILIPGLDANQ